jgi:hypothetical protein
MDETWRQPSQTIESDWSGGTNADLHAPVSKRYQIVIVHADDKNGFVLNASLSKL